MPLVRNRSEVPHRYYDYARKAYLVWAPGEVRDVPHAVAQQVCQAHPGKMELVLPTPEPEPVETTAEVFEEPTEEPAEVSEDTTDEASDMAEDLRRRPLAAPSGAAADGLLRGHRYGKQRGDSSPVGSEARRHSGDGGSPGSEHQASEAGADRRPLLQHQAGVCGRV